MPQSEIDTLANILAACINSAGPASTACAALFSNAKNGSNTPTDTAAAAINIAHNPGANIAALYGLQTGSAAFQPMLSAAPNDFTIAVSYNGGGLDCPEDIAIDAAGNVWVTNYGDNSIGELSPVGAALSPSSGYTGGGRSFPWGSPSTLPATCGRQTRTATAPITELNSSGVAISGSTGDIGGGVYEPYFLAFDGSGNLWIIQSNAADSISELNSSGMAIAGSGLPSPAADSIFPNTSPSTSPETFGQRTMDTTASASSTPAAHRLQVLWAMPAAGLTFRKASPSTLTATCGRQTSRQQYQRVHSFRLRRLLESQLALHRLRADLSIGIAIDGSNHIWVTNGSTSGICEFSSTGSAISGSNGYEGGGQSGPEFNAVDGSGNLWLAGFLGETVVEFVRPRRARRHPYCCQPPCTLRRQCCQQTLIARGQRSISSRR